MSEWLLLAPECLLAGTLVAVLLHGILLPPGSRFGLPGLAALGVILTLAAVVLIPEGMLGQVYCLDGLARCFQIMVLVTLLLTLLCAWDFERIWKRPQHEFLVLLLASTLGIMVLSSSRDLVLLYVSLELTTFPLLLLTAFNPGDAKSAEGGLKYLVLAALGSAILLFGFSFLVAVTGETQFDLLLPTLMQRGNDPVVVMGVLCALAGIGFKLALVPFHMWAPDAYEGAPTPVTAFLSVAGKIAGFALALRFLIQATPQNMEAWRTVLVILVAASMLVGNFAAIPQQNIKRMLAYSSIAQAGYMAMGLLAGGIPGLSAVVVYLSAYLFMNLGAFCVVIAVERESGSTELSAYTGLAQRSPRLALMLLLALLSLAGIPPLAGFMAKFYLFAAVFGQGYIGLVVLAVFNSALSLYYYLRVIRVLYIQSPPEHVKPWPALPLPLAVAAVVLLAGILALGMYPGPVVEWAQAAALGL